MIDLLNAQERKALGNLRYEQWENRGQLGVGAKTIASLLEKGLMEKFASPAGYDRFRITQAGQTAYDAPKPAKPARRLGLKMLPPILKTADLGIGTPRKPRK